MMQTYDRKKLIILFWKGKKQKCNLERFEVETLRKNRTKILIDYNVIINNNEMTEKLLKENKVLQTEIQLYRDV